MLSHKKITEFLAMPLGDFVTAGTIPKPLAIGRAGRLIFGAGALFYVAWAIIQRDALIGTSVPEMGWWVGILLAFYYLPDLFVVGFSRPWGRWPQLAGLLIALALLVADFAVYGTGWALPLGWGFFLFIVAYFGTIGVAFLVAAILAVPGWEFSGFPHVVGMIRRQPVKEHP